MSIPSSVLALVELFRENIDNYKSPHYNETQLRIEFIDPFFEALGWDLSNRRGWAQKYKSVIHEDSLRIEGGAKSPDYSFRIGGFRKFFVETKKPFVNIKKDPLPAYQLRRYAWSAKLPISVLTDFEELAIYDTRKRPNEKDRASVGRIALFRYEDYERKWEDIAGLLSEEAVLKGALDRFIEGKGGRRGTEEVDESFLGDISRWRESLAKVFALRNRELSTQDLNRVVQATIDRIVFLRICEDRGIEEPRSLKECAKDGDVYKALLTLFYRADDRYNSGLFHFRREEGRHVSPDLLTPTIEIDDGVLREVINGLYFPESPYEFSFIPADILGHVYERFLGSVIRLTPSHRAVVEEKPEVRKAGGVYYTPTYIVDYIVKGTVGKLIEGKSPEQLADFAVLDPACGSGSFLLQTYQYLLNWHRDWYVAKGPDKYAKGKRAVLRGSTEVGWELTSIERKRILRQHLYGVDIDPQAVEVTKLSLLLRVLEGETQEQLALIHERALPDLDDNIRCGNSLVQNDILADEQLGLLGTDQTSDLNPFEWQEAFPRIFARGGFDAVVGNPPYVLLQWLNRPHVEEYLARRYTSARYKIDMYYVFLEQGVRLLRNGGVLGYITPSSYLRNKFAVALREFLLQSTDVEVLRAFQYPVFKASVDTCITMFTRRQVPTKEHLVTVVRSTTPSFDSQTIKVLQSTWAEHPEKEFSLSADAESKRLLKHLRQHSFPLGDLADAYFGIQTFDRTKYVSERRRNRRYSPAIDGSNINEFYVSSATEFVDFDSKAIKSGGNPKIYSLPRIGVRQIGEVPVAALLPPGLLTLNTIYNIYLTNDTPYSLEFLLGVLSSAPIRWYWRQANFDEKRTFPKIKKKALLSIPVPRIDFADPGARQAHDEVSQVVHRLIGLARNLQEAKSEAQQQESEKRIGEASARLGRLVADLLKLSDKDRAFVEQNGGQN